MSAHDEAVTLGELGRRLTDVGGTLTDIKSKLENIPDWRDVQRVEDGLKENIKHIAGRVLELEDGRKWVSRQIGAALLAGFGGLVAAVVGFR
jgi:hypothetical protein